jgi:2-methylcitrate dehydratase PrpD
VRIEDIADIRLGVATSTIRTIGEPIERKRAPETGYQAQFSGPYMVALGFLGGGGLGASLDDFADEHLRDPARLELMSKVSVVADADCDAIFPDQFPAVLTVTTHDGQEHVAAAMSNRGGGVQPLTEDELCTKFRDNARRRLDAAGVAAVEAAVMGLAGTGGVAELTAACAGDAE